MSLSYGSVSKTTVRAYSDYGKAQEALREAVKRGDSQEKIMDLEAKVREKANIAEITKELKDLFFRMMEKLAAGIGQISR